jgi:hypothetical protein
MVEGRGFRPNSSVRLQWRTDAARPDGPTILVTVVTTDAAGNFTATPALVYRNDPPGLRTLNAEAGPGETASAPFLVVPGTSQPAGNQATTLRRIELLER